MSFGQVKKEIDRFCATQSIQSSNTNPFLCRATLTQAVENQLNEQCSSYAEAKQGECQEANLKKLDIPALFKNLARTPNGRLSLQIIPEPKRKTTLLAYIKEISDQSWQVTDRTLSPIDQLRYEGDIDDILAFLDDTDPLVRLTVVKVLSYLKDNRAIPTLLLKLNDKNASTRIKALETLGDLGQTETTPYLIPLLKDPDIQIRLKAIEALGKIGDKKAVPHLLEILPDANDFIRGQVISALGNLDDQKVIKNLLPYLKDDSFLVRAHTVVSIGRLGGKKSLRHLLPLLKDPSLVVRQETARILGEVGNQSTVRVLRPLLSSFEDQSIGDIAQNSINRLDYNPNERVKLVRELKKESSNRWEVSNDLNIHDYWANFFESLAQLKDADQTTRFSAIHSLRNYGEYAIPYLLPLLHDPDIYVSLQAGKAIKSIQKVRSSIEFLLINLNNPDAQTRENSVRSLGDLEDKEVTPYLLPLLQDPDGNVRLATIAVLRSLGDDRAIPGLTMLLNNPQAELTSHKNTWSLIADNTKTALEDFKSKQNIDHIYRALKNENANIRRRAVEALGRLIDEDLPHDLRNYQQTLLPLLRDSNLYVQFKTVEILGKLKRKINAERNNPKDKEFLGLRDRLERSTNNDIINALQRLQITHNRNPKMRKAIERTLREYQR